MDGDCVSALDLIKGYKVAILGIDDICSEDHNVSLNSESYSRPKRLVRHLKLLRHFRAHENIARIKDVYSTDGSCTCIRIVTDLMDTDLQKLITSPQNLSDQHVRYIVYQILRGLKFIHSAGVVHRDLRPANIFVNANCDLKICGFGLAASPHRVSSDITQQFSQATLTYTVPDIRSYHAPELLLGTAQCFKASDMWSVGCILAELLGRKPLFKGDFSEMLRSVVSVIGTPADDDRSFLHERAAQFMSHMPECQTQGFGTLFPAAHHEAIDLLSKLLVFDPRKRLSVRQALEHPYFQELHDPADEPICRRTFDFEFEAGMNSEDECHELVRRECEYYSMQQRCERAIISLLLHTAQSACMCVCRSLESHVLLQTARVHAQKAAMACNVLPLRRAQRLRLLSSSSLFGRLVRALMSHHVPVDMRRVPLRGLLSRVARLLLIRNTFIII